jgi:hypothetical protein
MEKRTIMEPVMRSPRWVAIEEAVEKVMARRSTAVKPADAKETVPAKQASPRGKGSPRKGD